MTGPAAKRIREAALSLRGKRVVVAGLGFFGGGAAAARYLVEQGADVLVTDLRSEQDLVDSLRSLEGLELSLQLGSHDTTDFVEADLVVANPAIPFRSEYLQACVSADVPLTTEVGLFLAAFPGRSIAVTGTSGKTTTTTLIGEMMSNAVPDTIVGGNMGVSMLPQLASSNEHTTAVLELSSFQLRYLDMMAWRPDIAVVTNIAPNHLDVHDGLDDYVTCKQALLRHQTSGDIAVLNTEGDVWHWETGPGVERRGFGLSPTDRPGVYVEGERIVRRESIDREICGLSDLTIPGRHNQANACAAASASRAAGVRLDIIAEVLVTFQGVAHRLERCGVVNGVAFYNDSIATSPERTMVAIDALDQPIVLIAGGSGKGLDYSDLGKAIDRAVKHVILIGETAGEIERSVSGPVVECASSLEQAVRRAVDAAEDGDAVLLSPASASYDMFTNFEERGLRFKDLLAALQ